jgi:hypothetical protein
MTRPQELHRRAVAGEDDRSAGRRHSPARTVPPGRRAPSSRQPVNR